MSRTASTPAAASSPPSPPRWTPTRARCATTPFSSRSNGPEQLETAVRDAQAEGAIDLSEDPEQLAFELDAYLLLANAQFVVSQESAPIDRARRAIERRLTAAAPGA